VTCTRIHMKDLRKTKTATRAGFEQGAWRIWM